MRPGQVALESGDRAVLVSALLSLAAKLASEAIGFGEVAREPFSVGALPLGLRRPDTGPTGSPPGALRGFGAWTVGTVRAAFRIIEGQRVLGVVRLANHSPTISGRDEIPVRTLW